MTYQGLPCRGEMFPEHELGRETWSSCQEAMLVQAASCSQLSAEFEIPFIMRKAISARKTQSDARPTGCRDVELDEDDVCSAVLTHRIISPSCPDESRCL